MLSNGAKKKAKKTMEQRRDQGSEATPEVNSNAASPGIRHAAANN
jgi:hypothetical protein